MTRLITAASATLATVIMVVACSDDQEGSKPSAGSAGDSEVVMSARYDPASNEPYANGKRVAGRAAQRLATFESGAEVSDIAQSVRPEGMSRSELEKLVAPLTHDGSSRGEVEYAQLSGVTSSSLGAMVLVRQEREDAEPVTRVFDVRLVRNGGPWRLDRIASVGGEETERPEALPAAAAAVLDDPSISLPDSARWDIYAGRIDTGLLRALAQAARSWDLAVTVLETGHPANVWQTTRRSAHSSGNAADIYSVDGKLVLDQRRSQSAAYEAAAAFVAGGAAQVGSPWIFSGDSFTDEVHQDHVHVQQSVAP